MHLATISYCRVHCDLSNVPQGSLLVASRTLASISVKFMTAAMTR